MNSNAQITALWCYSETFCPVTWAVKLSSVAALRVCATCLVNPMLHIGTKTRLL